MPKGLVYVAVCLFMLRTVSEINMKCFKDMEGQQTPSYTELWVLGSQALDGNNSSSSQSKVFSHSKNSLSKPTLSYLNCTYFAGHPSGPRKENSRFISDILQRYLKCNFQAAHSGTPDPMLFSNTMSCIRYGIT